MSKKKHPQATPEPQAEHAKPKRTKKYTFPDIDGGGKPVSIEATSIEEATALFRKGRGNS